MDVEGGLQSQRLGIRSDSNSISPGFMAESPCERANDTLRVVLDAVLLLYIRKPKVTWRTIRILSHSVKRHIVRVTQCGCLTAANQEAKDALEYHSKQMLHRFEQLEAQAAGLQESNDALVQQVSCARSNS